MIQALQEQICICNKITSRPRDTEITITWKVCTLHWRIPVNSCFIIEGLPPFKYSLYHRLEYVSAVEN
jgi:hypothetical protein